MRKEKVNVPVFAKTVEKSCAWVAGIKKQVPEISDDGAFHILKAVLQTLRDHLPEEEAAHFAAQLPMLLRGAFYEGWRPAHMRARLRKPDDFILDVLNHLGPSSASRIGLHASIQAAMKVIRDHVSEGEMKDVMHGLPQGVRSFF